MQLAERYEFVHIVLETENISSHCQSLLENMGVECIEQAGPGEAYGIVHHYPLNCKLLESIPGVIAVHFQEPPCAK